MEIACLTGVLSFDTFDQDPVRDFGSSLAAERSQSEI